MNLICRPRGRGIFRGDLVSKTPLNTIGNQPKEVQEKVHKIQVKKEPGATGVIISPVDRAAAGDKPSVASDVPSQDTASKATARERRGLAMRASPNGGEKW